MSPPINAIVSPAPLQGVQSRGEVTGTPPRPADLSSLPQGAAIRGEIIGNLGRGSFLLQTDQGSIVIRTDQVLKVGNQVTLKLDTVLGQIQAKILLIDGVLPEEANLGGTLNAASVEDVINTSSRALAAASNAAQPATIVGSSLPSLPASNIINATLIASSADDITASLPASLQPAGSSLVAGAQITVRLTDTVFPATTPNTQQPAVTIATPVSQTSTFAPTSTPTTAAASVNTPAPVNVAAPSPLPTAPIETNAIAAQNAVSAVANVTSGPPIAQQTQSASKPIIETNTAAVTVNAEGETIPVSNTPVAPYAAYTKQSNTLPPAAAAGETGAALGKQQAQIALSNGQIAATVLPDQGDGTVVQAQTPIGTLQFPNFLTANGPLSGAKQLFFDLLGISPENIEPEAPAIPLPAALPQNLTGLGSALRDALAFLASDPQTSEALLSRLPQIGSHFTASTLAFFSALNSGAVADWLGANTLDRLRQQGQGRLADHIGSEFSALRDSFLAPPQNQWQLFVMPYLYGEELQQARLFLKKEKQKPDSPKKTPDTRFVIEVSLSMIGDMQFDGLVRKKEEKTQFDLVLRTHQPLLREDEITITDLFNEAAQLTGFAGSIAIQSVREFPVKPLDEMVQGETGSILA